MPLISTTSALFNAAFFTAPLSPGVLNDVSIFSDEVGLNVAQTLVDVGLCTIPFSLGTRRTSILSGTIHWTEPLSWHGLLDIEPDTHLYLMVQGDRNSVIRVESRRLVEGAKSQLRELLRATTAQS